MIYKLAGQRGQESKKDTTTFCSSKNQTKMNHKHVTLNPNWPRLVSSRKWRMAILFMMMAYFPMFGQKTIDPQENAAKDKQAQHESTATLKAPPTGSHHLQTNSEAQKAFNVRLQEYVDSCMNDPIRLTRFAEQKHTCSAHEPLDIESLAKEEARNEFIIQNLEVYKHLFISSSRNVTLPEVCDNGGFEQDFMYYEGFTSTYEFGSDSCSPYNSMGPSVFIPATLPTTNRFEIVTSGVDPLVGINRTKFGDKALRINNRYGHLSNCEGNYGVDRITKTFEVTSENRIFSVWYAVVLENPAGHTNSQPFFSLKCDLAPGSDLCFSADYLDCDSLYIDNICVFDSLDVLDWTCHKFRIDPSFIGDTATLEITVADCGLSAHFGYAYIDGICEDCTGSATGEIILDSINYFSCDKTVARICGSYIPPEICNEDWWLDSIMFNGFPIPGHLIDTSFHSFCFDFPVSNFGVNNCLDVSITGIFTNGNVDLPFIWSNDIEVCKSNYTKPSLEVEVGGCMNNTPLPNGSDNKIISDDYYFVYVEIDDVTGLNWSIERTLVDPYPNEEYIREIATGTGNAMIELGPFKIQEGGWYLTLYVPDTCEYVEYIEPPAYCSGCPDFYNVKIGNVQCNPTNNTWTFDIEVPSETSGSYELNMVSHNYNDIDEIDAGAISEGCLEYTLDDGLGCVSIFMICPPKPCSTNCNLEVYVEDVPCTKDEFDVITFYVDLEVKWPPSKYACYEVRSVASGNLLDDGPMPSPQQVGPFTEDIYIKFKVCNSSSCTSSICPCYKSIYVPTPDCNQEDPIPFTGASETQFIQNADVFVQPNPTHSGEIVIYSNLTRTEYEILDVHGKRIVMDSFIVKEHRQSLQVPPGMYFLKYRDMNGHESVLKIIKQ